MKTYQRDGGWYLLADGGRRNTDIIGPEEIGPFTERPEPIKRWREYPRHTEPRWHQGTLTCTYALFAVEDTPVALLCNTTFANDPGYSWSEWHETFVPLREAPVLGECYTWDSWDGWVRDSHPQVVPEETHLAAPQPPILLEVEP